MISTILAALALLPIAGLVAKGLGAIAIIFGLGVILGIALTVSVTSRVKRFRHR